MELLSIGKDIATMAPKEFFERSEFNHIAALEFDIFLFVEFGMKQFHDTFIFHGIVIEHLKERLHVEIPNFYQSVIQGAEHIKYLVSRFILGREESIPLKESLINVIRKTGDIEHMLLVVDHNTFLLLNG